MEVHFRPYLIEFLEEISKRCEIILFSSETVTFSEPLFEAMNKYLKKNKVAIPSLSYCLCQAHCSFNKRNQEIKDISYFTGGESNRTL
mmetsp:Transcript_27689/g.20799  ORF Transcript_27689/g.20799 Transcript_27689/m.20799 type:complete len:88 (+) Transcript_27689:617-880(+)